MRVASTSKIDTRVKQCALELQDRKLLAKLSTGDMVAINAKYHINCLAALYNPRRSCSLSKNGEQPKEDKLRGLAFAELLSCIDEFFETAETNVPYLKLADLVKLYKTKLKESGVEDSVVNSTRLKERIILAYPGISAHSQGRDVLLTLDSAIRKAVRDASEQDDVDADGMCLAKAAKLICNEILKQPQIFTGTFAQDCEDKSIPPSLKALITMILKGPVSKQSESEDKPIRNQASRSISQLIIYNTTLHKSKSSATSICHNRERESPLPIYAGLKIHGLTRGRALIDTLFN